MRRLLLLSSILLAPVAFAGAPSSCSTMTSQNVFIAYSGAQSACNLFVGPCQASEQIQFAASAFGYNFSCATHTFVWNFGDGATATGQTALHVYTVPGVYTVTLTVSNGMQTFTTTTVVTVAGATIDAPTLSPAALALLLLLLTVAAVARLHLAG